jgi:hypothetical protein
MLRPAMLCMLCSGCGGLAVATQAEGGVPDGSTVDAQTKDAVADGAGDAWTQCSAPGGVAVCGGPSGCPSSNGCFSLSPNGASGSCDSGSIEPCITGFGPAFNVSCHKPPDGAICVYDAFFGPYSLGVLMAEHGGADELSYADHGLWTGAPLPAPASCPAVSGLSLCGPHCASCPQGGTCTGRSPLHPYGICIPSYSPDDPPTTTGDCFPGLTGCLQSEGGAGGCLRWIVEPQAQTLADDFAFCLPLDVCQAIGAGYPDGGMSCVKSVADAGSGDK